MQDTPNPFDRFAKEFFEALLGSVADVRREYEVETPTQKIDIAVEPKPGVDHAAAFARLGWLARMTARVCVVEPYSRTPGLPAARACLRKQLAWDNQRTRKAEREKDEPPEFPYLWIVSTGVPRTVLETYRLEPKEPWPPGFHVGTAGLAMGVVVLSELERSRDTLLLRLLGRGDVLRDAMLDARRIESEELHRMTLEILGRRRMAMLESGDIEDRDEASMFNTDFDEFKQAMLDKGRDEGRREVLLELVMSKFGTLSAETKQRIEGASVDDLRRLAAKVLTAGSVDDLWS